jgi:hypothetical protein
MLVPRDEQREAIGRRNDPSDVSRARDPARLTAFRVNDEYVRLVIGEPIAFALSQPADEVQALRVRRPRRPSHSLDAARGHLDEQFGLRAVVAHRKKSEPRRIARAHPNRGDAGLLLSRCRDRPAGLGCVGRAVAAASSRQPARRKESENTPCRVSSAPAHCHS